MFGRGGALFLVLELKQLETLCKLCIDWTRSWLTTEHRDDHQNLSTEAAWDKSVMVPAPSSCHARPAHTAAQAPIRPGPCSPRRRSSGAWRPCRRSRPRSSWSGAAPRPPPAPPASPWCRGCPPPSPPPQTRTCPQAAASACGTWGRTLIHRCKYF